MLTDTWGLESPWALISVTGASAHHRETPPERRERPRPAEKLAREGGGASGTASSQSAIAAHSPCPQPARGGVGAASTNTIELSTAQLEEFKRGLLACARSSNAWVVTGGTDSGVMGASWVGMPLPSGGTRMRAYRRATGLVGKAMAQQSTDEQGVCLGVTTYGVVRGHEDFDLLQERTGNKGVERVHAYDTHALRRRGAETEERRIRIGPNGLAE